MDAGVQLVRSQHAGKKVAAILLKRIQTTDRKFAQRLDEEASAGHVDPLATMMPLRDVCNRYSDAADATQRPKLFWDALWQRGSNFIDDTAQGPKPVLNFDNEIGLELHEIRSLIVLFASMDDNITPQQRALSFFADVYRQHGGNGARQGHFQSASRKHRTPHHFFRHGCEEKARADRVDAQDDREAGADSLRHDDCRNQGRAAGPEISANPIIKGCYGCSESVARNPALVRTVPDDRIGIYGR